MQKNNLSPEVQQQEQEEINKAKLDHQLKEIDSNIIQCSMLLNSN